MDNAIDPLGAAGNAVDSTEDRPQPGSTSPTAEVPAATPSPPPDYGAPEGQGFPGGFAPPPGYGPPPGQGPPPGYGWDRWPPSPASSAPSGSGHRGATGFLRSATVAWIVAGLLALTVAGLSVALASRSSSAARILTPSGRSVPNPGRSFGGPGFFGGGAGSSGVVGTVASVANGHFTVTDRSGATVTVDEQSSTTYYNGATSTSSSAVVTGSRVAVQGSRSANTVTATRVIVLPVGGFGPGASS